MQTITNFLTIVRDTFAEMSVGIEILRWATEEGKDEFVNKFLVPLCAKFMDTQRKGEMVDKNTIMVSYDVPPELPFTGAMVKSHCGVGKKATLQKNEDTVFIDGKKVQLHFSDADFRLKENMLAVNANILDAMQRNSEFFPANWKRSGDPLLIFFSGTEFLLANGSICIRGAYFYLGKWSVTSHVMDSKSKLSDVIENVAFAYIDE